MKAVFTFRNNAYFNRLLRARAGQRVTCGSFASSGIQALGCSDRRWNSQSQGCSTAWRMRPNRQCARLICRSRDRGGAIHDRLSKPSCNCPLGMRNLLIERLTHRKASLAGQRPTRAFAFLRQGPTFTFVYQHFLRPE